ncbi:MAG: hypothetical protein ACUVRS_05275 [Armatimonadota bacterium]
MLRQMRYLIALLAILAGLGNLSVADGPPIPVSTSGKIFALSLPTDTGITAEFSKAYENSGATAVLLNVTWEKCEPNNPGKGSPKYDFAPLDNHPLAKISKTRIVRINLENSWAEKIKSQDPAGYWKLVESFVQELVKYAGSKGISHFAYRLENIPENVSLYYSEPAETLKHIYKAAKSAMPGCTIIVEQSTGAGADAVAWLYRIGAKGSFDAAAIRVAKKPCEPTDMFEVVAAHRELARNGDENKKLLIIGGCVPESRSTVSPKMLQTTIENDIRNILTERDIYDTAWVVGEIFELPNLPSHELLKSLPTQFPQLRVSAQLTSPDPLFNYVVETPYKLSISVSNQTQSEIKLENFGFALRGDQEWPLEAKRDGEAPTTVPAGGTATASFTVSLPKETAGRQVTLVSTVNYSTGGRSHSADSWLTMVPIPQYEITILPFRLILDPRKESGEQVGMSVINHTKDMLEGKITLSPYTGIKVKPAEFNTKIDALGLEGFAFNVDAEKGTAPGHYAVFVDVAGKAKEWQAVDVALLARKVPKAITIDGKQDDWQQYTGEFILLSTQEQKPAGKGYIAYDDSCLYLAIELTKPDSASFDPKNPRETLLIGFDPLIDGARVAGGGYREDDYELELSVDRRTGPVVKRTQAPPGKPTGIIKPIRFVLSTSEKFAVYEISIPWSELEPLHPTKDSSFAISVLAKIESQTSTHEIEWGGGLRKTKDPRMFLPVILSE